MNDAINSILDGIKEDNEKAIKHLNTELEKIRAGRANPSMLDTVVVEYYGNPTPINQVANVNTLDARTITVQPWEKGMLDEIAKGIMNANLGLNPQNNGESILINVPMLTEERRKELVKRAKAEGEKGKVSIRNHRKDGNDMIKELKDDGLSEDLAKRAEEKIQQLTDQYINRIDEKIEIKEQDIMTV